MTKMRIPETNQGIQGEFIVADYDEMQRRMLSKGWVRTQDILNHGLSLGHALEIGPGPAYLGLEWLKHTTNTTLVGLDISPDMLALAQRNAARYGLSERVEYRQGNGAGLPFDDCTFDLVFTNGSLHEWQYPQKTFDEIWRVLKPSGKYFISDLRRDMNWFIVRFLWFGTQPVSIRPGLLSSIAAAYTPEELRQMLAGSRLKDARVESNPFGVSITGSKPA